MKNKTINCRSINNVKSNSRYKFKRYFFVIGIIINSFLVQKIVAAENGVPYFQVRSESVRQVRRMVGNAKQIYHTNKDTFYGLFTMTPGYGESFDSNAIENSLWGSFLQTRNGKKVLPISGSAVANRNKYDLLADYLFLPPDYQSQLSFSPSIKNFFVDFAFYFGLDEWYPGAWLKVWTPFQNTRWSLNPKEEVLDKGIRGQPAGYFDDTSEGTVRGNLLDNALDFFDGGVPTLSSQVIVKPLSSARIKNGTKTKNGLADIRVAAGLNIINDEDKHLGAGFLVAAPAGSKPRGDYIFGPIIGNGAHWEIGAAITSHMFLWNSSESKEHVGLYFDANITHLLETMQTRCFDLFNKPMSRYMLASKMVPPPALVTIGLQPSLLTDDKLWVNSTPASGQDAEQSTYQFGRIYSPIANLTATRVMVSAAVQIDAVLMFNYTKENLTFDTGYNLWVRSCGDIQFDCNCLSQLLLESWALKGDAHMYAWGASDASGGAAVIDQPVALAATQSTATAFSGAAMQQGNTNNAQLRNIGIDNPQYAMINNPDNTNPPADSDQLVYQKGLAADTVSNPNMNQTRSSQPSSFIRRSDINLYPTTKSLSHTLFVHLHYVWDHEDSMQGSFGVGGEIEFANNNNSAIKKADINKTLTLTKTIQSNLKAPESCAYTSISQWQLWIKGGINF